jgi:hypothetical protein
VLENKGFHWLKKKIRLKEKGYVRRVGPDKGDHWEVK